MVSLEDLTSSLSVIAEICDARVILSDKDGNYIQCIDSKGNDIQFNNDRFLKIFSYAKEEPIVCRKLENGSGILCLSLGDYYLFIDSQDRFMEEQVFIKQFKSVLPLIASTVGGDADIFNKDGIRIYSCHSNGKLFVREKPYSKQVHTAMADFRPIVGASNVVKGGTAVRFPISKHYGLGFNNERSVMQKEKLLDRTRHFQYARYTFSDIIGVSDNIDACKSLAKKIAMNLSTVFLFGETGTGKELFAHSIHNESPRCGHPFITVNCGSLPGSLADSIFFGYEGGAFTGAKKEGEVGIFEQAHGGTLLLDEISELDLGLQTKLLRVLQEKELTRIGGKDKIMIDVRIIAASNKALEPLVEKNLFRQDLYNRLNVVEIGIPPLRERIEDIVPLVNNFLFTLNRLMGTNVTGITQAARECLESYMWPGNVRELYNYIERALNTVTTETNLDVEHFPQVVSKQYKQLVKRNGKTRPQDSSAQNALNEALNEAEKEAIENALNKTDGNREAAAAELGISTATLWRRMKKYQLMDTTSDQEEELIYQALESTNYNRALAAKKLDMSVTTLWRKMKKYNMN